MAISDMEYEIGLNIGKILESDEFASVQKKDLAVKLGIPASNFSDKLIGKRRFHVDELCQLADALGVSTDYLLGRPGAVMSPAPDMQSAVAVTKLSQKAIENIMDYYAEYLFMPESVKYGDSMMSINHFLESKFSLDFFRKYQSVLRAADNLEKSNPTDGVSAYLSYDIRSLLRMEVYECSEVAMSSIKKAIRVDEILEAASVKAKKVIDGQETS